MTLDEAKAEIIRRTGARSVSIEHNGARYVATVELPGWRQPILLDGGTTLEEVVANTPRDP